MNINECKKFEPIFNSWYVKSVLGQGSFGTVFEIQKEEFGKVYSAALKVISIPQNNDEIERMRMDGTAEDSIKRYYDNVVRDIISELVIMSELKGNSNIVSYEDHTVIKHDDDIGYDVLIRMELLTPLMKYRSEHGMTVKDVAKLGIDLCRGLELCEKNNVIHRDIKPENIFVAKSGNYKLGDFGIARTIEKTNSELSRKGTYSYMAPEVYKGQLYDQTVDIYSLGIVMYSMLNGTRTPFLPPLPAEITHNDKEKSLNRRFAGEPLPAIEGVDSRLMDVINKACAYRSEDRYATAAEMRRALERIQDHVSAAGQTELIVDAEKTEILPTGSQQSVGFGQSEYIAPTGEGEVTEILGPADVSFGQSYSAPGSGYAGTNPSYAGTNPSYAGTNPSYAAPAPDYVVQGRGNEPWEPDYYQNQMAGGGKGPDGGTKKRTGMIIALCAILAILLAVCGVMIIKNHSGGNAEQAATVGPEQLEIVSWDTDFSNSWQKNDDATYSYNIIMLIRNTSDYPITGMAYKVRNHEGNVVQNMDNSYGLEAPFYAEGYIAPQGSGLMVSRITISDDEFKNENPQMDGHRPKPQGALIEEAYIYTGEDEYVVPTGQLYGEDKVGEDDYGNGLYNYNVKIYNNNANPIHEESGIVAAYIQYDESTGYDSIVVSSANGQVPREIAANSEDDIAYGMQRTEFGQEKYKENSAGEKINIEDYTVYVIDHECADGTPNKEVYDDKYAK